MPAPADGLRFPHARVLLPRTRLAYIHLANLLNDAKRDRSARVFGYVAIWLEKEVLMLYLQEGEIVTATVSPDGREWMPLPIAQALAKVPASPEFGAVCFHEATDELLACMYHTQTADPEPWPSELTTDDPRKLFPYLMSNLFDGLVEVAIGAELNYLLIRDGTVRRAYFAGGDAAATVDVRVLSLFGPPSGRPTAPRVRRFAVPPMLPVQASPALLQAYREVIRALITRLVANGCDSAPAVAEHVRVQLLPEHDVLADFVSDGRVVRDPVVAPPELGAAMAAWTRDVLWATGAGRETPEQLLAELGRERRHLLQSTGFWDALPWRVTW